MFVFTHNTLKYSTLQFLTYQNDIFPKPIIRLLNLVKYENELKFVRFGLIKMYSIQVIEKLYKE